MEKMIQEMAKKVDEFEQKILQITHPQTATLPHPSRYMHLREEIKEIIESHSDDNFVGVVDGLVDLVYVALGTLLQMGIHPDHPFDLVHNANMKKRGAKTERHEHDAIKPEGWQPPDYGPMLERLDVLNQVSPVFVELTELRIKKGNAYNGPNVKRSDHFPLGDLSYFQVIWMKTCRVRALIESLSAETSEKNRRLINREVADILVYGCFWLEYMRGLNTDK